MKEVNSRKRKRRPITSCLECYRRKQKCDRELPCAICVVRGIPEKCTFGAQPDESFPQPATRNLLSASKEKVDPSNTEDVIVTPSEFDEQTGYSTANGSNFSILQKSLQSDGDYLLASNSRAQNLPEFVIYQMRDIEKSLPHLTLQVQLIDLYFDQTWWWFSSLEPTAFRQSFDDWQRLEQFISNRDNNSSFQDAGYFLALLFQVLAISLQYLPPDEADIRTRLSIRDAKSTQLLSIRYSKAGMQIMDLLGRQNSTVTAVQHDMLRGIWLKNNSRGTESWYSLGNAIRQAQELGLHLKREVPTSLTDETTNNWWWQDTLRHRVWACLFSWDAHVAFTLGRPRIINPKDCIRLNLIACNYPADTYKSPPPITSDDPRTCMITPILFHYSLSYLIHEMLDLGADKPTLKEYDIVGKLHGKIDTLLNELPSCFRPIDTDTSWDAHNLHIPTIRCHMVTLANTYLVALHRAHVLRRLKSCEAGVAAALRVLAAQEQLFVITPEHKWRIYTYSFYTIDSSIFLAALLLERPATLDSNWYTTISKALIHSIGRLEQMKKVSPMAATGLQLLQKCYDRIRASPVVVYVETPVQGSTQTSETGTISTDSNFDVAETISSPSFKAWIEQMDQVMLPILEANASGPFDNALWEVFLEG